MCAGTDAKRGFFQSSTAIPEIVLYKDLQNSPIWNLLSMLSMRPRAPNNLSRSAGFIFFNATQEVDVESVKGDNETSRRSRAIAGGRLAAV